MAGFKFKKEITGELNAFNTKGSVDGFRKGCVEGIKRMKISKLPKFMTENQPTRKRHSGSLTKMSKYQ